MQSKVLVLSVLFSLSAASIKAQKHQEFTMPAQKRVIKSDTIVLSKTAIKPAGASLLAVNAVTPQQKIAARVYKPVPLAGQQDYFGSMNDYVIEFVMKYFQTHNKTLDVVQGRGAQQFSMMDNVLAQHDIPKELKYLAVIESALNNKAVSRVGAVGPWQFMASTARLMGLTVNGRRDDRKDWYKSTNAAAKYLTYLYGQLNDWLLVVAAYNSGPTPVQRAIQRTGSTNFWDIKKYLPRETQGHVLAFIATATIFEQMNKFIGLDDIPSDFCLGATSTAAIAAAAKPVKPQFTEEELKNMAIVRLNEPLSFDLMVQELAVDKKLLAKWNPDYEMFVYDTYNAEYYSLRIPKDKLDKFVERKEFMQKRSKQIFAQLEM